MTAETALPTVVIVGRPNVGKSTLFNRCVERRKAIVQSEMGTTRDRIYDVVLWEGRQFRVVDTGGHKLDPDESLSELVNQEVATALSEADLVLFVVEKDAISAEDHHLADIVKKSGKEILYVVNKVDNEHYFDQNEIYRLGFTEPIIISALHGRGVGELLDEILEKIPTVTDHKPDAVDFNLCIIGEPNAGKSTLLNKLLKEERAIVSEVAGTTRDSVEEIIDHKGVKIRLIDTAGLKRKRKVHDSTTVFSLSRAKEAIRRADVVLVLFDAEKGPQRDTRALFEFIDRWKKTTLLIVNKWDLIKDTEMHGYEEGVKGRNEFLRRIPMYFISALTGRNVQKLIDQSITMWKRYSIDIKTKPLNEFVKTLNNQGTLPSHLKIKYMAQVDHNPPAFIAFVNNKKIMTKNHFQHITNQLIETFDLYGVQIDLIVKQKV